MTTTSTVTYIDAMKAAARIVKERGWRDPDDDTRLLQVTRWNFDAILRDAGEPVPEVFWGGESDPTVTPTRHTIGSARPVEHDDGSLTITCAGPCGETKPAKKFGTRKNGGREAICRACRDAARAANR